MSKIKISEKQKIVFKIHDHFDVSYEDMVTILQGKLKKKITDKDFIHQWLEVKNQFPRLVLNPVFTSVSPNKIEELINKAIRTDPSYKPVNFLRYFYAIVNSKKEALNIKDNLAKSSLFKSIEIREKIKSATIIDPKDETEYINGRQNYLNAGVGINMVNVWKNIDGPYGDIFGIDGTNVNLRDVEYGWSLRNVTTGADGISNVWEIDHEDFKLDSSPGSLTKKAVLKYGANLNEFEKQHGTSVLGIIAAQQNGKGCIGIAPNCNVFCYDATNPDYDSRLNPIEDAIECIDDAIMVAISDSEKGDILLLEIEYGIGEGKAIEIVDIYFDLIRFATALDIVVIEPAGNETYDLDDGIYSYLKRNTVYDSGAIMVGGVRSTDRKRINGGYGSRVDCFAWYTDVTAPFGSGYGSFIGTSAASAIIAGVAVAIQGFFKAQNPIAGTDRYRTLNSRQMRALLSDLETGTKSANPSNPTDPGYPTYLDDEETGSNKDKVGVMPNLGEIIKKLNKAGGETSNYIDIYIRDYLGDLGDNITGAISVSPDIITRNRNDETDFGSITSEPVVNNVIKSSDDNYIYVRVFNRGDADAENVEINVFYASLGTMLPPSRWIPVCVEDPTATEPIPLKTFISNVPANSFKVSGPIHFNNFQGEIGHYCYVGVIGNSFDNSGDISRVLLQAHSEAEFTMDEFERLVRNNNNIAWKNFEVVEMDIAISTSAEITFLLIGDKTRSHIFDLSFTSILPLGTVIHFEIPNKLTPIFKETGKLQKGKLVSYVTWKNMQHMELKNVKLPKGLKESCKLIVKFPNDVKFRENYHLSITQYYNDLIVGKITWVIKKKKKFKDFEQRVSFPFNKKKLPS